MTKNEFIQQACLEIVPAIYQQRLDRDSTKASFRSVFVCADLIEQIAKETGIDVFDGEPHEVSPYQEYDKIPISSLRLPKHDVRFQNVCYREKIEFVGDLLRFGANNLMKCRDIGATTIMEVRRRLREQFDIDYF